MKNNDPWTEKEIFVLKSYYADMNNEQLAALINRSVSAIEHKAHKLRLKKSAEFFRSRKSGRYGDGRKPKYYKHSLFGRLNNWIRKVAAV